MVRVAKLELPESNIDDPDIVCIPINRGWIPVMLSAVARLELKASWVDGTDMFRADQNILNLYLTIKNAEGCGQGMFDVRQNEDAPCVLEKTNDGDTWVQFADLSLCPAIPAIASGGDVFVQHDGELIPFEQLPPDVDTVTTSDERRPEGSDGDEARCLAALNAAYVFRLLHQESWKFTPFTQKPGTVLIGSAIALVGLGIIAAPAIPLAAAAALIAFFFTGNANQFTSTIERELACILKNRSYISNGEVFFDFALIKSDVTSRIVGINIWSFINGYLDVIGANGLNLAGTTTAITCCADPCSTSTSFYDIDLTVSANRNLCIPVTQFNNSAWTWIAGTGWRLASVGATAEGGIRAAFPVKPNSQIVNVFWRFTVSHEPYNWFVDVNGATRNVTGYQPFGNFFHGLASPLNVYAANISTLLYAHINAANNSSFTIDRIRIEYRGCSPL